MTGGSGSGSGGCSGRPVRRYPEGAPLAQFCLFSGAPSNPPTHNGSCRLWMVDGRLSHTRTKHNWDKSVISIHMLKRHTTTTTFSPRERDSESDRHIATCQRWIGATHRLRHIDTSGADRQTHRHQTHRHTDSDTQTHRHTGRQRQRYRHYGFHRNTRSISAQGLASQHRCPKSS